MIAHVAEADEQRGRVVLWLGANAETQDTAVDAALRLAQAFGSEMESLFIADDQLFDLAELPFAREISLSGRRSRVLSSSTLAQDLKQHASALQRRVLARARSASVKAHARVVRAEPVQALAQACTENGPWNVVTVGSPIRRGSRSRGKNGRAAPGDFGVAELFDAIHGTTGIVVAGPRAQRTSGPVIAVVEEIERLVPMMRAAERIASATGGDARLWLLEHDRGREEWMEGQIRLALASYPSQKLDVIDMTRHSAGDVAGMMRRQGAGFVITRFGGRLAPDGDMVAPLAEELEGPLMLVR
jgi:hypothetical protein